MQSTKPILLVEDDRVDVMTIKRVFNDIKITNQLIVMSNGQEALGYLKSGDNRKPCLILLDLNMPKMNGLEFLKTIKENEALKRIPIIVFTVSKEDNNVTKSFKLGAAGYMVKPVDYKKFVEIITAIHLYWTLSELPEGD
jgi:CheY-like chemotaxis protein